MIDRRMLRRFATLLLALIALLLWLLCLHWFTVFLYELLDTARFFLEVARRG